MLFHIVVVKRNTSLALLQTLLCYHPLESLPCETHITGEKFNVRFHTENALFLFTVTIMHSQLFHRPSCSGKVNV